MSSRPKCYSCNQACRKNQKFLICNICNNAVHRKCANMSAIDLRMLKINNHRYMCKLCTDNATPMLESDGPFVSSSIKFDCDAILDPTYLNNLFLPSDDDDDIDLSSDFCFKPIPARYFSVDNIYLENFDNNHLNNFSNIMTEKFSSIGINMRSLSNSKNFSKLQVFLESLCFKPSVIGINETYLRDNDPGPHCNMKGYNFISNCRKSHKGGGVGIYVLDTLNYKVRNDLTIMDDKIFESLFIEIKCKDKAIVYGTIYRSPNSDIDTNNVFLNYLKKCLKSITNSNKLCFIQGDLNYDLLDIDNTNTGNFTDTLFDYTFYPHINLPTRITGTSATCIDHIWSNVYDYDVASGVISETIADHMITFQCSDIDILLSKKDSKSKSFRKTDYTMLESELKNIDTNDILNCNNLDVAYEKLESEVTKAVEVCTKEITPNHKDNDKP